MPNLRNLLRNYRGRHALIGLVVFVLIASAAHFIFATERTRLALKLRSTVAHKTLDLTSRLKAELNANVFLANGMFALVSAVENPNDAQINRALKGLYSYGRHVRNVGVAPGNRITNVYPVAGNEKILGFYYPDSEKQWPAVKRAIDLRATILAGPVQLLQGGSGLISRTPVFREDGDYWGILSLVLDADALFHAVGLTSGNEELQIAIRGRDGTGSDGAVFLGDPALFETESPVLSEVAIPGGTWMIATAPRDGWQAGQDHVLTLEILSVALAGLLGLATYLYQRGQLRLANNERRLRTLLETVRDGVVVIDGRGLIHEFNRAAERMFGYEASEMVGTSVNRLMTEDTAAIHDEGVKSFQEIEARLMASGRQAIARHRDGSEFPVEIMVGDTRLGDRQMHVGLVRDITERKAFESRLLELASIDSLTGALNRRAFMEAAENYLMLARRHGRPLAFMMIDADHFKKVNDTYGHHVGDVVLVRLASTIIDDMRGTDKFGRLGGEEFAVILPETTHDQAISVAERLLATIRALEIDAGDGRSLRFTVSIGLASLTQRADGLDALIQQADAALYEAKGTGRDRWSG